jgi:hypothetical protein
LCCSSWLPSRAPRIDGDPVYQHGRYACFVVWSRSRRSRARP